MNTVHLTAETSQMPLERVLQQAAGGGLEIRDAAGIVVALVLSPKEREERLYAEAFKDLDEHREEVERAIARRGGITTAELLKRAADAAARAGS